LNLDANDRAILEVLMKDGRASLREIAARTDLTAPTVSLHLSRMQRSGLIRGFSPVLDPVASHHISAFVKLEVPAQRTDKVAESLSKFEQITGVFVTTGKENVTVRVVADDVESLQEFVNKELSRQADVEVVSSDIVTRALKDARDVRLSDVVPMRLKCDYCHQEITANRPYNIKLGPSYLYFCCRTCRRSYLERNRAKIRSAVARIGITSLHS
jgi:Lrp/AsnC family transcriptional regulator, leucine-responsive regulatory protein